MANPDEKVIKWIASSKKDFLAFPDDVIRAMGYSLGLVQAGDTPDGAKVLHGFGGGVWELVEDYGGNAYRAVYIVRFHELVYVLHCFQKKAKTGSTTPKPDMDLIRRRLAVALDHYERRRQ